jgi:predicted metal-dependent phosphoesterase TrpH
MYNKINDWHFHTNYSDGNCDVKYLLDEIIKANQIESIAITDHNTVEACKKIFESRFSNKKLVFGIEFSTNVANVHILGLGVDPYNKILANTITEMKHNNVVLFIKQYRLLQLSGISISEEDYCGKYGILDVMKNAEILVRKGYAQSVSEAYTKYLDCGRIAYVPESLLTVDDIVSAIHGSGGIAILAHPHSFGDFSHSVDLVIEHKLDGVEIVNCRHYNDQNILQWVEFCKKNNLTMTTGSDCHNIIKYKSMLQLILQVRNNYNID